MPIMGNGAFLRGALPANLMMRYFIITGISSDLIKDIDDEKL